MSLRPEMSVFRMLLHPWDLICNADLGCGAKTLGRARRGPDDLALGEEAVAASSRGQQVHLELGG
jgi:hypothetical protein